MTSDRAKDITVALIGDEHRDLYLTDAGFRYGIDVLAAMLAMWVDAMAEKAVLDMARQVATIKATERVSPMFQVPSDYLDKDNP